MREIKTVGQMIAALSKYDPATPLVLTWEMTVWPVKLHVVKKDLSGDRRGLDRLDPGTVVIDGDGEAARDFP